MARATPERFGDYELVERLGVGGMAETFLAIRRGPGGFQQRVCLKRILPTFVNESGFVEMFVREARLSALLHHGHIARVLDFGITNGTHYLTLELIEGTDLRVLLRHLGKRGESLDPGLTSYLAHALASALDFAHTADEDGNAAGIIHRDVSPSNVLLSEAGEVKLADFGIAKATNLQHPERRAQRKDSLHGARVRARAAVQRPLRPVLPRCAALRVPRRLPALRRRQRHPNPGPRPQRAPQPPSRRRARHPYAPCGRRRIVAGAEPGRPAPQRERPHRHAHRRPAAPIGATRPRCARALGRKA
ncbi:MAG: serine/threonine protein kinase [Deltaproteobacteria bacterium]|nr:MAG: serine/threonine protein kinase [Deltaproteobacteria bacterium]